MQPYSPLQFIKLNSSDKLFDNLPKTLSFWPDRQTYCKVRFHLCKVMIVPCSLKTILGSTISLCSWDNLFCKFGLQLLGDLFDNFPSECQGLSPPDQIGKLIVSQVSVSVVRFSHQLLPSFGLGFCVIKTWFSVNGSKKIINSTYNIWVPTLVYLSRALTSLRPNDFARNLVESFNSCNLKLLIADKRLKSWGLLRTGLYISIDVLPS